VGRVLDLINYGAEKIQLLILLLMRTAGILMTAPIFSHKSIPRRITVAMSLGLAVVLMPLMANVALPQTESLIELIFLCLKEVFVGVIIGLVFTMIFLGIRLAGSIVGYQIGFAMVNVVDPNSPNPVSILGEFWFLLATLIFLAINGHHIVLSGLVDSFKIIPLGMATPSGAVGEWFMKYSSFVFVLAIKFAAPVIITVFLTEVSMGVLARTMPQMNIFIVGFPLKIFIGLFLVGASLPAFSYVLRKVCANLDNELAYLMKIYQVSGVL
jgi:flagellar biosynthetic protein FliR